MNINNTISIFFLGNEANVVLRIFYYNALEHFLKHCYFAPGVIINKLNVSLCRNHNDIRYIFCLPFPPF